MSDCLIIFAKAPVHGCVKTRLIPQLGAEVATDAYRRLLEHVLEVSSRLTGVDAELWCSGEIDGECAAYANRFGLSLFRQTGADLGERMNRAFEDVLQRYDRAVLVGSDSPEYDPEFLFDAFRALEHNDAVFGPAEDGGYLLIGLQRPWPGLFRRIAWSSERVMAQTRDRLAECNLHWHELPVRRDIDQPEDLAQFPQFFSD